MGLNYAKIQNLAYKILDLKSLIFLAYFSADKANDKGKYITLKRVKELLNGENVTLCDLIGIYQSGNKDIFEKIVEMEKAYIKSIIYKASQKLNLHLNKMQYEEVWAEAQYILLYIVNRVACDNNPQIVSYMNKILPVRLLDFIAKNYFNPALSFEDKLKYEFDKRDEY